MMIRINLLPVRQSKKRETGRQFIALGAAVLLVALVANYLWLDAREKEKKRAQDNIAATDRKIKELEKVIGEVNKINQRKKELEDKLKVLAELRKGRSGPVKFLDALSTATPQKVWIESFEESGNAVRLVGSASSHDDVAEYMRSLRAMVWTPRGIGRLVEQKKEATTSRVELIGAGTVEEIPVGDVHSFFGEIELKTATQKGTAQQPMVGFELTFSANYSV